MRKADRLHSERRTRNVKQHQQQQQQTIQVKKADSGVRRRCRAWSPDDVCRPSFFPPLRRNAHREAEKNNNNDNDHNDHNDNNKLVWCPICAEEMDSTDYSFRPCPCGFRLCLFCYNTIVVQDGRCPGCRNSYQFNTCSFNASSLVSSAAVDAR